MRTYDYPVTMEPGDADPNVIVVTFPDLPEAISEGGGHADALEQAAEALGLVLLEYVRRGKALPKASAGKPRVTPEPAVAAKVAVIEAFHAAGISQIEFARRIGRDKKVVSRILDPGHETKLPLLTAALATLGQRLVIGVEAA